MLAKLAVSFLIPEFPLRFGLAFFGAMPMSGPVAVLFMTRLLAGDRGTAALIALGGALVEGSIALGIAFALPQLVGRTKELVLVSLALGAVVITTLGILLAVRPHLAQRFSGTRNDRGFARGAITTLFNPTLLATWTLAVGTLYANGWLSKHIASAAAFAVGVSLGSLAWNGILIGLTKIRHTNVAPATQTKIMRAMGGFLVVSGAFLGVRFVLTLTHHDERQGRGLEKAGHLLDEVSHRRNR